MDDNIAILNNYINESELDLLSCPLFHHRNELLYNDDEINKILDEIFSFIKMNKNLLTLSLSNIPLIYTRNVNAKLIKYLSNFMISNDTIQNLNLSTCGITVNVINVLSYTNLISLNLSDNSIGDLGVKYIAEFLKNNNTLQKLNLDMTCISKNGCQYLSDALLKNNTLLDLKLSQNNFGDDEFVILLEGLKNNRGLIYLDLCQNNITLNYKELDILKNNSTLKKLLLFNNHIGENTENLINFIRYNNLEYLDLSNNHLSGINIKFIAEALSFNHTIKYLDLTANKIDEEIKYFYNFSNSLQYLDLSGCLQNSITSKGIGQILKNNNTLQTLDLSYNDIDSDEFKYLLIDNKSLLTLNLVGCKLNEHAIEYLIKSLKNSNLQSLNLMWNELNSIGCNFLADVLRVNSNLQYLNLCYCLTEPEKSIKKLCEALKINKSLISLNLSCNNLKNDSIKYIVDFLEINDTLEYLDLFWNNIDSDGVKLLSNVFKINKNITTLNLYNNNLWNDEIKYFINAFKIPNLPVRIMDLNIGGPPTEDQFYLDRLCKINKYPNEHIEEFDKKLTNRILYFNIHWQPNKEIHFKFPSKIRSKIREFYNIIMPELKFHKNKHVSLINTIPFEIWIHIMQYLARAYID